MKRHGKLDMEAKLISKMRNQKLKEQNPVLVSSTTISRVLKNVLGTALDVKSLKIGKMDRSGPGHHRA